MIFSKSYNTILNWADKKTAVYYLAFLSFIEAVILPFPPPDILLAPIVLHQKNKAYRLALITTIFSVIGGIAGYVLGYFIYDLILPWFIELGYLDKITQLKTWFDKYGIWVIFIAGFSPIPYKLFTLTAGFLTMSFVPFVLISLLARGARFYLVAFIVKKTGDICHTWLKKYIDYLGYSVLLLFIIFYFLN